MTASADPTRRTRGRPPKSGAEQQEVRLRLLAATRATFARTGYHGLSVELVLAEAGLSRPTFYKYFRSLEEPVDLVLAEVNQQLVDSLIRVTLEATGVFNKLEAALLAWRDWGLALGPLLQPLFAELHDPHSPASRHRQQTLAVLAENLGTLIEMMGRARPSRLQLDALINSVEYLGYRYHLETPGDAASWQETREAMLRIALGLLGSADDWSQVLPAARPPSLDVSRNPPTTRPDPQP